MYPPATEEQLAAAEAILGFPLPPLLRALYANVANGDFGPGYGINGALSIANDYLAAKRKPRLIDIGIYEKRQRATHLEIPSYVHLDRFLTLCHWGCDIYSHLDCTSDRVFRGGAISREKYRLDHEASSLYKWLDLWSKDELEF